MMNEWNGTQAVRNKSATIIAEQHEAARDSVILALYGITACFAIVGNIFVCRTIHRKKRLQNSTTYVLIYSMALSDILAGLAIPTQWLFCSTALLDRFPLATLACGAMKIAQVLSYYVSSWTMAVIAYDRYCMICKPLQTRVRVRYLLALVWLLGLAFISICVVNLRISEYFPAEGIMTCRMIFKANIGIAFRRIRVMILTITQFLVPLIATAILYTFVMRRVSERELIGVTQGDAKNAESSKRQQAFDDKKRKTIKMLIIVTVSFALSNLPVHIYYAFMFYSKSVGIKRHACYSSTFYMLCYWFAISSCMLNPFIYCYFNAEFRHEALRYLRMITQIVTCGLSKTKTIVVNNNLPDSSSAIGTDSKQANETVSNDLEPKTTSI